MNTLIAVLVIWCVTSTAAIIGWLGLVAVSRRRGGRLAQIAAMKAEGVDW